MDELIVSVIKAMYEDVNGRESFNVKVRAHKGSVLGQYCYLALC